MARTGVLLVNLGTPAAPTTPAVRRYLREFLSDPRVIDISAVGRQALLNLVILPFRSSKSAAAYRKIWTERGSPLLFHSQDLAAAVQRELGDAFEVVLAMRYGEPSIAWALDKLGDGRVIVCALYPQYAASSTGSSLEEVMRVAGRRWVVPDLATVPPFWDDAGFLDAWAAVARPAVDDRYVLFSFHGLPERQIRKADASGAHCFASASCCDAVGEKNRNCYRAQSYATARGIAARLGLADGGWSVSFQSRLGRTPWIEPHTDVVLPELVAAGKKRIAVVCPAFVADCLETLEEIGIRAQEQVATLGGDLVLVPSLNATPVWVTAVTGLIRKAAGG
jgi:ferrochelatase